MKGRTSRRRRRSAESRPHRCPRGILGAMGWSARHPIAWVAKLGANRYPLGGRPLMRGACIRLSRMMPVPLRLPHNYTPVFFNTLYAAFQFTLPHLP